MDRSNILFVIERALRDRGFDASIRSVADFRSTFPSCPRLTDLEGLQAIARDIPAMPIATLKRWQKQRRIVKPGRPGKRRLSVDAIRSMRSEGVPVTSIASAAGVTRSRVYQILREEKGEI
jgi:hypothetical protein